ncbi:MAG: hypothetical protein R3E73_06380 [Porticoccaceae bacterium]
MLNTLQRRELISLQRITVCLGDRFNSRDDCSDGLQPGAFIPSLQAEFGLVRGISLSKVRIPYSGVVFYGSIAGRLCDRYGAAVVGLSAWLLMRLR